MLGVGPAALTLAAATVREPVGTALDVGTGCGVQSLHLSQHAGAVTGTDVLPRALAMARLTARLNGLDWELVEGDLLGPVAGRRFDLVVSNPPFIVGPGDGGFAYRDSGLAGDEVCRRLIRQAPDVLDRRRPVPAAGQLGAPARARTGGTGWPAGSTASAATPGCGSARSPTRRSTRRSG